MSNLGYNIIILATCWLLVTGAGVYVTYFEQPKEVERLEKAEKLARLRQAEVTALLAEETSSTAMAQEIITKWRARYKIIPEALKTPDIVGYLNRLTAVGFKNFDVKFSSNQSGQDFGTYTFKASGRAYYTSLYKFIWEVENNRNFYRVRNLALDQIDLVSENKETGKNELQVLVSFKMDIDAYYGGVTGLSAGDEGLVGLFESDGLPITQADGAERPPVPSYVLPEMKPITNPFYPLILNAIPPNTYDLLEVENAVLVSIVGENKAVFLEDGDYVTLGLGDPVYLGQITLIDPTEGRVLARLNRGGIIDEVEMLLQTGERFRQAEGDVRLSPIESQ